MALALSHNEAMASQGGAWVRNGISMGMVGLLVSGALGACASPPTAELAKAELAVSKAQKGEPEGLASRDLQLAREKFDQAREATRSKQYDDARRLAEQALVDAELAEARSESASARTSARQVYDSIDALRDELDRNVERRYDGGIIR